jgi:hypothetical protein
MQRAIGGGQGNLVVSRDNCDTFGSQRLSAAAEFGEVRYFLFGKGSSADGHDLILPPQALRRSEAGHNRAVPELPYLACGRAGSVC